MMYGGNTVFDSFIIIVTLFLTLSNAFLLSRNLNSGLQYAGRDGLLRIQVISFHQCFDFGHPKSSNNYGINLRASFNTNCTAEFF